MCICSILSSWCNSKLSLSFFCIFFGSCEYEHSFLYFKSSPFLLKTDFEIDKFEANFRQQRPNKNKEDVSTKSMDTWTNQALLEKLRGIILKKFTNKKVAINLIIATIPIVLIGGFFNDLISQRLITKEIIAFSNIIFASLLLGSFYFSKSTTKKHQNIFQLTMLMSFLIGCIQIFAFT